MCFSVCLFLYTRQNNKRVTQWTFPYMVYFVKHMAEIRQDFEKWFSVSKKGIKNEAFPIKMLAFKIFIFIVFQNHHFAKFSNNHVLSFLLMSGLCAINSIQWVFDF